MEKLISWEEIIQTWIYAFISDFGQDKIHKKYCTLFDEYIS